MTHDAKLSVENLRMEYYNPRTDKRVLALDGIDLEVEEGEFISVVGPSGCGKTTFLNLIDGLIQSTDGVIRIDGKVTTEPGPDRAMVFQQPALLPWRTVWGNLMFALECQNRSLAENKTRAEKLLELVGLSGFEDHYPHELSGGMQQRVNLARALLFDPEVLLMDEPFAALDAQTREVMQLELLRIWREMKKTVIFITHQLNEAIFLSDRVAVFSARPSRVKEVIPIDLPRPRDIHTKRQEKFLRLEDQIWSLIDDEVNKAMAMDRSTREAANKGA